MQPKFKAPNQDHAVRTQELYRDTRSTFQQFVDSFKSPVILGGTIISMTFLPFAAPEYTFICSGFAMTAFWLRSRASYKENLPFRMPFTSFRVDHADPKPGRTGFNKACGTFYIGNTFGMNTSELWLGIKDMLTHMLIFGTTGSGKTETLVSLAFNALAMGSGLFYVDPKGSPKLNAQIYVMSRICGRDDDFRCINYLTGDKASAGKKSPRRTSNMINPFSYGNAESLSNMLNSLIPKAEGSNAIFSANARSLMKSIMYSLVEMRDSGEIQLSSRVIRDYLTLGKVLVLAERKDFTQNTQDALRAFLTSVGWQEGKSEKEQPKSLPEQFGYARSYFGDPLNNLTDTYGHIYGTAFGEVDMRDVVMQRRILTIIIPSLAMASDEVKSLGVISLSAIRIAIAVGLGTGREATFAESIHALPTDAPAPFLSITDEYAAIPTPGYVEVLTQGRGLGIAAIVASQDLAGISKADKEGAQQLLENTKCKLFMKLTAAGETFDEAKKLAGEVTVMESGGMSIKPENSSILFDYRDNLTAQTKERAKVVLADFQDQIEGEYHAFFGSTMVRGRSFYANPPLPGDMQIRYNHLVAISPPDPRDIEIMFGKTPKIVESLMRRYELLPPMDHRAESDRVNQQVELVQSDMDQAIMGVAEGGLINEINQQFRAVLDKPLSSPMDTAIAALVILDQSLNRGSAHVDHDPLNDYLSDDEFEIKPIHDTNSDDYVDRDDFFNQLDQDESDDDYQPFDPRHAIDDLIKTRESVTSQAESLPFFSPKSGESIQQVESIFSRGTELNGDESPFDFSPATQKQVRTIRETGEAIIDNHPRKPMPKDDPNKKDFLSQSLAKMLADANTKK